MSCHRVLAFGALGAVLLLAGCGSKGSSNASATTSTSLGGRPDRTAFNSCLQQHGVDPAQVPAAGRGRRGPADSNQPDGSAPPGSAPPGSAPAGSASAASLPANVQQALQACQSLLPRGGQAGSGNSAYGQCLQQHGVTAGRPPGTPPDTTDPKYQAARQACASLRPNRSTTTSTAP